MGRVISIESEVGKVKQLNQIQREELREIHAKLLQQLTGFQRDKKELKENMGKLGKEVSDLSTKLTSQYLAPPPNAKGKAGSLQRSPPLEFSSSDKPN